MAERGAAVGGPRRASGRAETVDARRRRPSPLAGRASRRFAGRARGAVRAWLARRGRARAADAVAGGRVRLRHRPLFHRRARAGLVGGARARGRRVAVAVLRARAGRSRFRCCSALAAAAAGFATATVKTRRHRASGAAAPALERRSSRASSRCARSASAPTASSCASQRIDGRRARRRRRSACALSVRKGTAPAVGTFVELKARLDPAAAAAAAGRLRLRARSLFPAHRRVRLCARRASRSSTPPARARPAGCATRPSSTASATRSTSASARWCRATRRRSPRR